MATRNYVDSIVLTMLGKDFDDMIVDFSEKRSRATKAVNTMNRAREIKGFKRGNKMYTGSMTVEESDDPTAPDWDTLLAGGVLVNLKKKPNAGKTVTFIDLTFEEIDDNYSDGTSTRKLNWQARRRVVG